MPFGSIGSFHAMALGSAVMPMMNIAPVGITVLSSTATSITISFTPPDGVVTGYVPFVNGVAGTGSGTHASYTITGLTAGQTYSIMMHANMSITGGAAPNFLPTSIPGCALWFDAADTTTIVKTGSSVSQWNDKSGNGYSVVQPTSGNQPTHVANSLNGYGGIQFANTRYLYQLGSNMPLFSASSANSVYIVARNNSSQPSTGWGLINTLWFNVGGSNADTALKYHFSFGEGTTNGLRIYVGTGGSAYTGVGQSTAVAFGANAIVGFSMSSATTLLDVNGSYANYAGYIAQNTNLNNKWFMFGDSRGGYVVDMIIYEMIGFNTQLSITQQQQVEGYLAWKWNLKSNLPASHPYYSISGVTVSSVTFSPLSIPGCSVWLDAADSSKITLNGSGVSQWVDKSSNGFVFTQSTAGNQPTYSTNSLNGLATLQFTAANSTYLGGGTNYAVGTNSFAIFAVFRFSDTTSNGSVFNKALYGGQQGRIYLLRENNGTFNFRVTDPVSENNSFADTYAGNTYRIMSMTYNRTAGAGYIFNNGTLVSSYTADKTTNLTNTNNFIIGGYNNGSGTASPPQAGFYLNGNIAEIICYTNNYDMTWGIQQQIEGYLASKWGIRSYLNTSHPFYSVPALTNAYSTFNPKSISGLNVWWDGADPNGTGIAPVNGASIATWVDKSGSGYNATASVAGTYSSSPVGVNFGTTGYYTTSYPANPTNESCFIVFNKSSNNQMMMIGTNAGGREVAMQNGTTFGTVNSKVGWSATMSAGSATGVTHIGEVFVSGGTSTYVNFNGAVTLTGPSAVTAFTSGILTNLGREAGAEFQYLGYIQEILFYNSVLTFVQRQQVEGYLAWKWGVQTNLPVAHPYYSTSGVASVASVGPAAISYTSVGSVVKSLATISPLSFYLDNKTFLINYYRFEAADITGTSLLNFSSGSYDATLTSATITSTVGKYKVGSSALALTSQYATINSTFTTAQTFSNGVSFAYWFYTPAINGYQRTFDFGVSGTSGIAMYTDQSTGQLGIFIPSTTVSTTLTGTVVTDGVWRHTVFTINTSGLHTIYINGAIVKTVSSTFPSLTMTGNFIGKSSFSGDVNFTGGIDDFRVYNCVLSANDAKQLYAYTGAAPSAVYFPLSPAWTPSYSSLVAYFMLDETSGSTTAVEQIGANNGTVVTGVTFGSTGKVGTCVSFNGTGYLNIPFQTINNLTSYTICVWVYINSYSSTAYPICAKQSNGTASHHILTIGPWSGTQDRRVYFYPSNAGGLYYTGVTIETGVWTHIAVTGTGSNLMFYINGKLDSNSYSGNFSIPNMTSGTGCAIGYAPGDLGGRIFTGQMDDFAVWNVALTSDNIATIYSYQSTGVGPPTGITPVSSSSSTSLTVSFTAPVGSAITYTPYVNGVAGTGSGTPSSYTFTGLTAGTRYSVSLSATSSYSTSVLSAPYVLFSIPSGVMSGSPTIYYPFWIDTKDYATGTAVTNATFNGTTPPSISTAVRYKSYAQNSVYSSNGNCNMSIPSVTINSSVGFTVCFWFYLTSATPGMLWTANANPFSTRTFIYWFGSYIRVNVNGADNNIHTNISLNTWYFITLVQPAGGVPYSSLNNGTNINLPNYVAVNYPTSHHYLYGDPYVGSNFGGAIGYMNNFYFFNRALSASEITAIYNQ